MDGKPAEYLVLNGKDGRPRYMITPDRVMLVQLAAFDDSFQHIVDDKLIYRIARDERIQVEGRNSQGKPTVRESVYNPTRFPIDRFPITREGSWGFCMVGTHHLFTNFRVAAREPRKRHRISTRPRNSVRDCHKEE